MLYIHFPNMARCVCVLATILHSIACCTKLLLLQATMYYYSTARATHCRQLVHSYGTTAILCACPTTHIWHLLHTLLNPKLVEISPSSSYFYLVRMFSLTLYWALCFSFERSMYMTVFVSFFACFDDGMSLLFWADICFLVGLDF